MKILILGGTGAIGSHLCPLLVDNGNEVVCTSRKKSGTVNGIKYIMGDAKDQSFLESILIDKWDVIYDFMVWSTNDFNTRIDALLNSTKQYIFTSSYRVFSESKVITENSPLLLDSVSDELYLSTDEYALSKARCEKIIINSNRKNWTIIRPAITYDGANGRLQIGVDELETWFPRVKNKAPIPFPEEMLNKHTTMTYAGDVAKMIFSLAGNSSAFNEVFIVSGNNHLSWKDVIGMYKSIYDFRISLCDLDTYMQIHGGIYQIKYDRMFDRIIDNSKILSISGLDEASLTSMKTGIPKEFKKFLDNNININYSAGVQGKLDKLAGRYPMFVPSLSKGGFKSMCKYLKNRFI